LKIVKQEGEVVPIGELLCELPGRTDRWIVVAAHFDHLGVRGGDVFRGADDNAAGVAVLVELSRRLREGPTLRRGVLFAAFDAEEPPYFLTPAMGSEYFAGNPTLPLESIDLMVCMDLIGHAVGPSGSSDEVRRTLFALGAERCAETQRAVDDLSRAEPGLIVRRVDAESLPVLSDYWGFWTRGVPFLFLTGGRDAAYHTPQDLPERLDLERIARVAGWLERCVRRVASSATGRFEYDGRRRDDAATLRTIRDLARELAPARPATVQAHDIAVALLARCSADGRLGNDDRPEMLWLVGELETVLAIE
jgi:Iap family predicted aminopeptidase